MIKKLISFKRNNRYGDWLFLLPFLFFACGYFLIAHFFGAEEIETPALIGKPLQEAARALSARTLNLRIITEKPDAELQPGTILSQTPAAGKKIKANQSVFIVISKSLPRPHTPNYLHTPADRLPKEFAGITIKKYYLANSAPKGHCFAQYPAPETPVTDRLILYLSAGNRKPIIWPDFTNKPLERVRQFLSEHHIEPHIIFQTPNTPQTPVLDQQKNQETEQVVVPPLSAQTPETAQPATTTTPLVVTAQHPQAGTLLTLDPEKLPHVQLKVHELVEQ